MPPLLDELERAFALSGTAAGVLTSAPVLCFGILAPLAPVLARRLGAERALLAALVPVLAGVLLRALPDVAALFAGTILAGAGVAVGNVIVPSVIKRRFESWTGPLTGLFASALNAGAALAGGLTVPIERATGVRFALAGWAIPVVLAAGVVGVALARDRGRDAGAEAGARARALLADPLAWQVTLYMGLQSLLFYAGLAWLPSILRDGGFGPGQAGALLSVFAIGGIPASLLVPILAARRDDQRALAGAITLVEAVAVTGLLASPGGAALWVTLFALGQGGAIGLALTLMVLRAPDARRAADLSGMAQAVGYCIAAAGPLLVGALHDASGGWTLPLTALLALTVPLFAVGLGAGRAGHIGAAAHAQGS